MTSSPQETRVLAIASHVTHGYVGNKMATFVMQALGCDVSAIDTVHFSNHTAYKQFKGRRVPAEEIQDLYNGLRQSGLNEFDMMLSGYTASKAAVKVVGTIGRDLRFRANMKPGSFFWILDPVMGDEGRLYVAEEIVPAYKTLLHDADLILPNCFEAELLSGVRITDMKSLVTAITTLHKTYQIPHIVVTSLHISPQSKKRRLSNQADEIAVVGSTCCKDFRPRIFSVSVPALDIFFSGTGDMFAALTLVRMREAAGAAEPSVLDKPSWRSPDDVTATDLPLAKATEKTLASMHAVLMKTAEMRAEELKCVEENDDMKMHVKQTKASEVRVVRFVDDLRKPRIEGIGVQFKAEAVEIQSDEMGQGSIKEPDKIEVTERTGAAKLEEEPKKAAIEDKVGGGSNGKDTEVSVTEDSKDEKLEAAVEDEKGDPANGRDDDEDLAKK